MAPSHPDPKPMTEDVKGLVERLKSTATHAMSKADEDMFAEAARFLTAAQAEIERLKGESTTFYREGLRQMEGWINERAALQSLRSAAEEVLGALEPLVEADTVGMDQASLRRFVAALKRRASAALANLSAALKG